MSDDTKQDDTELFDQEVSEESDGSTDSVDHTEDGDDEQLDLDNEDKKKGEAQRQKQIDVWQTRIDKGEATIESLPANLKWMIPELKVKEEPAVDIDAIVEKKLEEKEAEKAFKQYRDQLNTITLTKAEKVDLLREYNDLLPNLPKHKALEKALKITGIHGKLNSDTETLRRNMELPKAQQRSKSGELESLDQIESVDELKKLSPDKIVELAEKQRQAISR